MYRRGGTYYVAKRMIEQKKAITSYASDYGLPATLTKNQWGILEKVVRVLAPVELMTREMSANDATVADVIPMLAALTLGINKVTDDAGVQTMKTTLLDAIKTHFAHVYGDKLYTVATLLDPRYKEKLFSPQQLDVATTGFWKKFVVVPLLQRLPMTTMTSPLLRLPSDYVSQPAVVYGAF